MKRTKAQKLKQKPSSVGRNVSIRRNDLLEERVAALELQKRKLIELVNLLLK
jgi:hypothetical protein